jgi:hypothetical protein
MFPIPAVSINSPEELHAWANEYFTDRPSLCGVEVQTTLFGLCLVTKRDDGSFRIQTRRDWSLV